jgi:hypothetical protein
VVHIVTAGLYSVKMQMNIWGWGVDVSGSVLSDERLFS